MLIEYNIQKMVLCINRWCELCKGGETMSYTVYLHLFPNGKTYIGITGQALLRRWREGKGYIGQPVYGAIQKYGWVNIEHIILKTNLTKEEAEEAEKFYIKKYNSLSHNNGYNVEVGGYTVGAMSEETKRKLSEAHKGKQAGREHWHYGQHWDEGTKRKISEAHKGMKYGEETLKKKRTLFSGKNNPMYGTKMDPEHKKKLQMACINATSKAVICVETGIVYKSSAEAQRQTGICARTIQYICAGNSRYKTAGGFHWELVKEVNKCQVSEAQ